MLGKGSDLVAWMCVRSINDNINFAVKEWLERNQDLEVVATRIAGAQTINGKLPMWLLSIARTVEDGTPIIRTEEGRETDGLVTWANGVFARNANLPVIDVQIAGAGHYCHEKEPRVIESTWAMLVIAKKRAAISPKEELVCADTPVLATCRAALKAAGITEVPDHA